MFLVSLGFALTACATEAPNPKPLAAEQLRLPTATASVAVKASLIKTGSQLSREGFTVAGGSLGKLIRMNYLAVLIRHPKGDLLYDAGLGKQIDAQYHGSMPFWAKPFLRYEQVEPAVSQLQANGINNITQIFLSHAHWDHASGLADFPNAEVAMPAAESEFVMSGAPPSVLPLQFAHNGLRVKNFGFQDKRFGAFTQSLDWFGDGTVVLVPLTGHTPGSVGLFLQTESGKRYFFVGDSIWNSIAIETGASKPWFVRGFADAQAGETLLSLQRIRETAASNPNLTVVPAHDSSVHDTIGFFPQRWLP